MGVVAVCAGVWLTALSVCDIRQRRLPNLLTLPGAAAVLALAAMTGRGLAALTGALVLFAVYLVVHLAAPRAMGAGDVKLAIGVGAMTGAFGVDVWALAALAAPVMSGAWAAIDVARRSKELVPHGVSMCVTAATAAALPHL